MKNLLVITGRSFVTEFARLAAKNSSRMTAAVHHIFQLTRHKIKMSCDYPAFNSLTNHYNLNNNMANYIDKKRLKQDFEYLLLTLFRYDTPAACGGVVHFYKCCSYCWSSFDL